ncbi:hypothetical protein CBOM_07731 [Ceraceosorus bombacis]|uniref:Uncharacterized protein n=1 Tax=Ceraceosorus bombacis TaxID=401625 RepID=A0A0P1BGY1_9BASI|nr:hypothetical protein CBOM_07731 [Ceraceosorus bombacis]
MSREPGTGSAGRPGRTDARTRPVEGEDLVNDVDDYLSLGRPVNEFLSNGKCGWMSMSRPTNLNLR